MCYHLIKRPFISGQVISTTDSKIPLWLLQTTLAPMWCLVSVWLPRLVLGALWASASPLRLLPTLLPPLPPPSIPSPCQDSSRVLTGWLLLPMQEPLLPTQLVSPEPNLTRCVLGEISWLLIIRGFFVLRNTGLNQR